MFHCSALHALLLLLLLLAHPGRSSPLPSHPRGVSVAAVPPHPPPAARALASAHDAASITAHGHQRGDQAHHPHPDHVAADQAAAERRAALVALRAKWPDGYLALCTVVKDQRKDLRYWVEYHRWLGVQRIYVYDHNSTMPLAPLLVDYLHEGLIEYHYTAGRPRRLPTFTDSPQYRSYQSCILNHYHQHRWLAFIDADEFVVLHPQMGVTDLNLALLPYEGAGALGLNWRLFGSSGHTKPPREGPLGGYTKCVPRSHSESSHVKVFANTAHLASMGATPHEVLLKQGAPPLVDEMHVPFHGPKTPTVGWKHIVLHHYVLKSRREFGEKLARGSGAGNRKTWTYFDYIEGLANATCTEGLEVSRAFLASNPRLKWTPPQRLRGAKLAQAERYAADDE